MSSLDPAPSSNPASTPLRPHPRYVSTGHLPTDARVDEILSRCHDEVAAVGDGRLSEVYPALTRADPGRFGLALAGTDGQVHEVGDSRVPFTLMSVAKPFVHALACQEHGSEVVRNLVGVDATGLPFNSATAVERAPGGRTNPMVNAGAIATTSLTPGHGVEERWEHLLAGLSRFAGRELTLDEETLGCAQGTNIRNRALALLLEGAGAIQGDPMEATELYTRQSCLEVTCVDLARMGACLADGGVSPWSGGRVVSAEVARETLAVMVVAGMYESSGSWLVDVGLPGKSGIGGGIVTVSPGKGALGTYSPLLDGHGNSVRGALAAQWLSEELGLDILASSSAAGGARTVDEGGNDLRPDGSREYPGGRRAGR